MIEPVPAIVDLLTARKKVLVKELEEQQNQHAMIEVRMYTLMAEIKAIAAYLNTVENRATEKARTEKE